MGRNTWESIGFKPLKKRTNIIISRKLAKPYTSNIDKNNENVVSNKHEMRSGNTHNKKIQNYKNSRKTNNKCPLNKEIKKQTEQMDTEPTKHRH